MMFSPPFLNALGRINFDLVKALKQDIACVMKRLTKWKTLQQTPRTVTFWMRESLIEIANAVKQTNAVFLQRIHLCLISRRIANNHSRHSGDPFFRCRETLYFRP